MYVTIREHNENSQPSQTTTPLTINNKEIKFFNKALLSQFRGEVLTSKTATSVDIWRLAFFVGTPFTVSLTVEFSESEPNSNCLAKAIWQPLQNGNNAPGISELNAASQWLRKSNSLKLADYEERNSRWVAVDGAGISMFSPEYQKEQFHRVVILLALACAYRTKIDELVSELSLWNNKRTTITKLAQKANEFAARCYFRHPIKLNNVDLPIIWEQTAKRLKLSDFYAELIDQTNNLNQLVADENRDKENRRWQLIGVFLGLISTVQIIGLVPDDVRAHWWALLINLF